MDTDDGTLEIKIVIVGNSSSGKTSASINFVHGRFDDATVPTIGASFLQKRVVIDGTQVSLQIWDTAGQERFRSLGPMYYRNARVAILVFDVTNEQTFDRLESWRRDLQSHAPDDICLAVCANKIDLPHHAVDMQEAESYAKGIGASFHTTSAKTGEGIQELFTTVCKRVIDRRKALQHAQEALLNQSQQGMKLGNDAGGGGGGAVGGGCC